MGNNLTGFDLTPRQTHDLKGAVVLLHDGAPGHALIADNAYNAQTWVIEQLLEGGKSDVIPSRSMSNQPH